MDKRYVIKWVSGEGVGYFIGDTGTICRWTEAYPGLQRKVFTDKASAETTTREWIPGSAKVLRLRRPAKGYAIKATGVLGGDAYLSGFSPSRSEAYWTWEPGPKRKVFATKAEAKEALTAWVGGVPDWMKIVRLVARKRGNGDS